MELHAPAPAQCLPAEAAPPMAGDHARGLHEGVADGGADELEAARLEVLAHRLRLGRLGGDFGERLPAVLDRAAIREAPEIGGESPERLPRVEVGAGVSDGRLDLGAVA